MMRVIGGQFRSRTLRTLRGHALRPTSDRLRETLFNILGPAIAGSVFVDLYAGTGAVGIEALSRGAAEALFVEQHAPAVALIERNLRSLGITSGVEILAMDAVKALERLAARHFRADFVFLDPPYQQKKEYARILEFLDGSHLLAPAGRVVVEHAFRDLRAQKAQELLPERLDQLERSRVVVQGDSVLSFYRLARAA
jgi:16S rRNA (guanine966-N2)-methyltransferase